jgi:hypothetical protein
VKMDGLRREGGWLESIVVCQTGSGWDEYSCVEQMLTRADEQ